MLTINNERKAYSLLLKIMRIPQNDEASSFQELVWFAKLVVFPEAKMESGASYKISHSYRPSFRNEAQLR